MRRKTRQKLILGGSVGSVILLLLVLLFVVLQARARQRAEIEAAREAALASAAIPVEALAVDPWVNQEAVAIERVQRLSIASASGPETVNQRVQRGDLISHIELFRLSGVTEGQWLSTRAEGAVYEVEMRFRFEGVEFGPRWFVQLDPAGPAPAGSGGVVAANALARQLQKPDITDGLRFVNRSREVVQALTEHRFEGGVRLGSAFLIFFDQLRAEVPDLRIIGWTIVPEEIDPDGELAYRAYFQWAEGETLHDAIWNISYRGGIPSFRAGDQRADDLMRRGATVSPEEVIDIQPVSLRDVTRSPDEESDARMRALRYLLADTRVVEAVGALLSLRSRSGSIEYIQWHSQFTETDRDVCTVEYRYKENGVDSVVSWRVRSANGARTPVSELAQLAETVLSVVDVNAVIDAAAAAVEGAGAEAPIDGR